MKSETSKSRRPKGRFAPATSRVRVVLEDKHIVVADKPPGLLTASTPKESRRTLFHFLLGREQRRGKDNKLFAVHKLDRDASGLVLFAKQDSTRRRLQEQLRKHPGGRTYRAVVEGEYPREEETFRAYLAQNAALRVYVTPDAERGRLAVTHIRVVRRLAGATLIEASQETNHKHQLRVQLAAAGHPIVGDRRYGQDRPGPVKRLALHATELEFVHPATGERLHLKSPVPARFISSFNPGVDQRRVAGDRPHR